ncbi:MAG TPA: hypothetical protein VFP62_02580 [Burkholderiales bacterium]|jgi:hypothetical protein|nr:hypothetical protein [Burkholderiales bacterium]
MKLHALVFLGAVVVAGCGGATRYTDSGEKNLIIRTETSAGSAFSSVKAVIGVHAVDAQCQLTYEGYVELDRPLVQVGIPPGRLSYLVFEFASSSFLGGTRGSISQETLLRPRPGATYEVRVTYQNELYEVAIRETPPRGGRPRDIELVGLGACKR